MGKTLLVTAITEAVGSSNFILPGSHMRDTVEANMKLRATEAMTFSNLAARVASGNSGQLTLTARKNGVAANETITIVGVAANEDVANTDTLAQGDDLGLAYSDTGTDTVFDVVTMNVSMASGHGSVHIASPDTFGFTNLNVPSATRFCCVAGDMEPDWNATESNVQVRNQAYTSWEGMAITVDSNARTNTTVFHNRINGADGSATISVATLLTGTFQDISNGDALVPGTDLLSLSVTLLTGTENFGLSSIQNTFKSTQLKSQLISTQNAGVTRAASATPTYYMLGGSLALPSATETTRRVKPGFAARCQELGILLSANTYAADATLKLFVDGVAVITTTITAAATGLLINVSNTSDIVSTNEISAEIVGGTSGSITIKEITLTFGPVGNIRANPFMLLGVGRGIFSLALAFLMFDEGRIGDISMYGFLDLEVIYENAMVAPGDANTDPPDAAFLNTFFANYAADNPSINSIVLDYEAWNLITDNNSPTGVSSTAVGYYVTLLNAAKAHFTNVGLYGEVPERYTLYLNFPPGHPTFVSRRANWFARAILLQNIWDLVDTIWPSFYYINPVYVNEDDRDMWYEDSFEMIGLRASASKPSYPFMWPRIHNSVDPAMPYISGPYWRSSLEKLRAVGYEGFALWLFSSDVDPRTLTPVPAWWLETVDFSTTV